MVTIANDLYVVVREMHGERAPQPRPLPNGFSENIAYRVLGLHSASETSEAYRILANDHEELWFISNKPVRAHGLFPGSTQLRFSVEGVTRAQPLRMPHGMGENPAADSVGREAAFHRPEIIPPDPIRGRQQSSARLRTVTQSRLMFRRASSNAEFAQLPDS